MWGWESVPKAAAAPDDPLTAVRPVSALGKGRRAWRPRRGRRAPPLPPLRALRGLGVTGPLARSHFLRRGRAALPLVLPPSLGPAHCPPQPEPGHECRPTPETLRVLSQATAVKRGSGVAVKPAVIWLLVKGLASDFFFFLKRKKSNISEVR